MNKQGTNGIEWCDYTPWQRCGRAIRWVLWAIDQAAVSVRGWLALWVIVLVGVYLVARRRDDLHT